MGNAFLIGDAAHRITPRGGTGMNTAIHDAFNLGWKLAFVARGWAGDELLDTYETERRPVDERNTTRSAMTDGSERTTPDGLDGDLGVTYEDGAFLPAGPVPAPSATPSRWGPLAADGPSLVAARRTSGSLTVTAPASPASTCSRAASRC